MCNKCTILIVMEGILQEFRFTVAAIEVYGSCN